MVAKKTPAKKIPAKKTPTPSEAGEKAAMKYANAPTNRAAVLPLKTTKNAKGVAIRVEQQGRDKVTSKIYDKAFKAAAKKKK